MTTLRHATGAEAEAKAEAPVNAFASASALAPGVLNATFQEISLP